MPSALLIDNWLLQDVGSCLVEGLDADLATELVIDSVADTHSFKDVPAAGVKIEALISLLLDIVFRDALIIDSTFTDSWEPFEHLFAPLLRQGLIRSLAFRAHENRLREPRRWVLDQLCTTSSLREAQRRNEESWKQTKEADDPYMSAVIWGTAGMLSRSHVFEAPYSGHPLRRRIIEQTTMAPGRLDVVANVHSWINEERLKLFDTSKGGSVKREALIVLPPAAIEVIEESRDAGDLINVALQLREKYKNMREWLHTIQLAVDAEDPKEIAKYKKTLATVTRDINRAVSAVETGKVSLKIGLDGPSLGIPFPIIDSVLKRFGARALLSQQVFSSRGERSLKKLLRLFGEETSTTGLAVMNYLRVQRL